MPELSELEFLKHSEVPQVLAPSQIDGTEQLTGLKNGYNFRTTGNWSERMGELVSPAFTRVAQSVEALKLLNLQPGQLAATKSYYGSRTGFGGAVYLIKSAAQAAEDGDVIDGRLNHALTNSNAAVCFEKEVDPTHFGAVGDGVAFDTEALLAHQAYLISKGLVEMKLGPITAIYRFTQPLQIGANGLVRNITGSNLGTPGTPQRMPTLLWDGPAGSYAITCDGLPHGTLQGFLLMSYTGLNHGMDFFWFRQCTFRDIQIDGFDMGLRTSHFWVATWENLRITNCMVGWMHRERPNGSHSDLNSIFINHLQLLHNDVGMIFGPGSNIRASQISANVELNRIGVVFDNFKAIQNFKIFGYWERNTESDIQLKPGNRSDPLRSKIDISDSYFFTHGPGHELQTQQIIDAVLTDAQQVTEIIMDRCNFTHIAANGFVRVTGQNSLLRFFGDDIRGIYDGGPNGGAAEGAFRGWKLASKGPAVSTIYIPIIDYSPDPQFFTGQIVRSVSRSGTKSLRGEITAEITSLSATARQIWQAGVGVFFGEFTSFSGTTTYYPVRINGRPQMDTLLRIQANGDGALVNDNGLGLNAGDVISWDINTFSPPT